MRAILELLIIGVLFLVGTIVITTLHILDSLKNRFIRTVEYLKNKFEKNKNL
jgi:hypothetical protein